MVCLGRLDLFIYFYSLLFFLDILHSPKACLLWSWIYSGSSHLHDSKRTEKIVCSPLNLQL